MEVLVRNLLSGNMGLFPRLPNGLPIFGVSVEASLKSFELPFGKCLVCLATPVTKHIR